MKRSHLLLRKSLITTVLAVPAAAMMLGAAHAGTSVGINFSASYYGQGNYASTAVTSTAFGVDVNNWFSSSLDDSNGSLTVMPSNGGSFTVGWKASGSDISFAYAGAEPDGTMPNYTGYPGDASVYDGTINGPYTVNLSGLATQFPNGYAVQALAAVNNPGTNMWDISISDGLNPNQVSYVSRGQFDYG
jgi:hypothetical protein